MDRLESQLLRYLGEAQGTVADHLLGGAEFQSYKITDGTAAALLFEKQLQLWDAHGAAFRDLGKGEVLRQVLCQILHNKRELFRAEIFLVGGYGLGVAGLCGFIKINEEQLQLVFQLLQGVVSNVRPGDHAVETSLFGGGLEGIQAFGDDLGENLLLFSRTGNDPVIKREKLRKLSLKADNTQNSAAGQISLVESMGRIENQLPGLHYVGNTVYLQCVVTGVDIQKLREIMSFSAADPVIQNSVQYANNGANRKKACQIGSDITCIFCHGIIPLHTDVANKLSDSTNTFRPDCAKLIIAK